MSGGIEGSCVGFGVHDDIFGFGGFHGLSGDVDGLGDLDVGEVLGERLEGEGDGGGLFLGVSAFFWGSFRQHLAAGPAGQPQREESVL